MEEQRLQMEVGETFFNAMVKTAAVSPGEVVMVFQRPDDKVLVITKGFYPGESYRIPTGKMKMGESVEEALVREVREETGFDAQLDRKLGEIHWTFNHGGQITEYTSHVMLLAETCAPPQPEDEDEGITGFREVAYCDLMDVAEYLEKLPEEYLWHDWGWFRGLVHEFVYNELCATPHSR